VTSQRADELWPPLFPLDRRRAILHVLQQQRSVATADLALRFAVNQITIRRDLRALARSHGVTVVHGGAVLHPRATGEPTVNLDLATTPVADREAQAQVIRKAAALVRPGMTVALGSSSTIDRVVQRLPAALEDCTFITSGLDVAQSVARLTRSRLLVAGGLYHARSRSMTGDAAVEFCDGLRADIALLGASAVDLEAGWTHPTVEVVGINRALLRMAATAYLLADSTSFGVVGLAKIAELHEFEGIVVDDEVPTEVVGWAREHGVALL
jgi:DeoR/GlpR family transcriptional regulator of sugar metabolism